MRQPSHEKAPGDAPTSTEGQQQSSTKKSSTTAKGRRQPPITVKLVDSGAVIDVPGGREAEMLRLLIERGEQGTTTGEASPLGWSRRVSAYIKSLRDLGLPIGKTMEPTPDGARVARYRLDAVIRIMERAAA